jgi:hypothetical protein
MDTIGHRGEAQRNGRELAPWRIVASAWALVALFAILFVGFEALAARCEPWPRHANLAGAVIPRHDPACAGVPSGECGLGSSRERAAPYGSTLW